MKPTKTVHTILSPREINTLITNYYEGGDDVLTLSFYTGASQISEKEKPLKHQDSDVFSLCHYNYSGFLLSNTEQHSFAFTDILAKDNIHTSGSSTPVDRDQTNTNTAPALHTHKNSRLKKEMPIPYMCKTRAIEKEYLVGRN